MKTFTIPKTNIFLEIRDYISISIGLLSYAIGWTCFLLPFRIASGGVAGVGAIVQYATGIEMQYTYIEINAILLILAVKTLGYKFCLKTIFAVLMLTLLLSLGQIVFKDYNALSILGDGHILESCIVGSCFCGFGIAICFLNNGSTGGTDVIAAIVNKYRDVSFGRMILYADIAVVSSSYFVSRDLAGVFYGFITMFITTTVLDYVINSNRQSVQFLIFSNKYEDISHYISNNMHRGVTLLDAQGYFRKKPTKVIICVVKRRQATEIFRIIKQIDHEAFISQSRVLGVYGNGFDKIKVR